MGALCEPAEGGLRLTAFAGSADGTRGERAVRSGPADDPEGLAHEVAGALSAVRR